MNITTAYLGLKLRSPLVPSASAPLTENIDNIKRMEQGRRIKIKFKYTNFRDRVQKAKKQTGSTQNFSRVTQF